MNDTFQIIGEEIAPGEKKEINLKTRYPGQTGEVRWDELSTKDDHGIIDIAKQIKPYKGAVMYAVTEFDSAK